MSLVNPSDSLKRQNEKLLQITQSLMRRVEQKDEDGGLAYRQFERAALLEGQVRQRTKDLERTLDLLQESNAQLAAAQSDRENARADLTEAIETINEGFALFDTDDRLVLFNSRFCQDLEDVVPDLAAGLSFAEYVSLVSRSEFLALPKEQSPEDWSDMRMDHHLDQHVVFNTSLRGDRWLQVSEHRTSGGGTVILQTDVSDIIQLERQERDRLRDAQARMLQATLDHLNQGVCIFDRQGSLVGWNTKMSKIFAMPEVRARLGISFKTLVARLDVHLTFDSNFNADQFIDWASSGSARAPVAFEVSTAARTYSIFAQEMPDRGFVISFTDVTDERAAGRALFELNEQLERRVSERTHELGEALSEAERANASKSRFVAAASHDLLQPLSAAKLFVSSLSDGLVSDADRAVLGKTEQALLGVEQIIEALLDISKLDLGKAIFNVRQVHLSDILDPLRDEMLTAASSKGLDLQILNSTLTIRTDPAYLRRILQNLLSNAVRYTDRGRILLGVRRSGDHARIEVWDTGRGIAENDQQKIFNEFQRLNPNAADAGLGLGLAIVERACKGLKHDLGVWSEMGTGSCFSVNVPISSSAPTAVTRKLNTLEKDQADLSGLLLLIVENDRAFAAALSMTVQQMGAKVIAAESAEEAIALLHEIQLVPDAFLFDYQLGGDVTGVELYETMVSLYGPICAAIVSADRTRELRKRCKDRDLTLLSKPVDRIKLYKFLADRALDFQTH